MALAAGVLSTPYAVGPGHLLRTRTGSPTTLLGKKRGGRWLSRGRAAAKTANPGPAVRWRNQNNPLSVAAEPHHWPELRITGPTPDPLASASFRRMAYSTREKIRPEFRILVAETAYWPLSSTRSLARWPMVRKWLSAMALCSA